MFYTKNDTNDSRKCLLSTYGLVGNARAPNLYYDQRTRIVKEEFFSPYLTTEQIKQITKYFVDNGLFNKIFDETGAKAIYIRQNFDIDRLYQTLEIGVEGNGKKMTFNEEFENYINKQFYRAVSKALSITQNPRGNFILEGELFIKKKDKKKGNPSYVVSIEEKRETRCIDLEEIFDTLTNKRINNLLERARKAL